MGTLVIFVAICFIRTFFWATDSAAAERFYAQFPKKPKKPDPDNPSETTWSYDGSVWMVNGEVYPKPKKPKRPRPREPPKDNPNDEGDMIS